MRLQVGQGLARMRLAVAQVPFEDLAGQCATPEAKATREGEDQAAEGDAKATSTISLPMPRWVIAVALAKSSTPSRIARASRRAPGGAR